MRNDIYQGNLMAESMDDLALASFIVLPSVMCVSIIAILGIFFLAHKRRAFIIETWMMLGAQTCFLFSSISYVLSIFFPLAKDDPIAFLNKASGNVIMVLGYYIYLFLVYRFIFHHPSLFDLVFPTLILGGAIFLPIFGYLSNEFLKRTTAMPDSLPWFAINYGNNELLCWYLFPRTTRANASACSAYT